MMRNIIGQVESSFDIRQIMDNKKILLVNLSKGKMGDLNSRLMGMIFVMKFQAAAMSRANIPESERQDFCLYVDEFQNFSTDSFATIMSEARKYHLNLVVANQFVSQLTDEIRDAVFGNIGTIVSYRVGQNDVDAMSRYFQPLFDADDLLRVPNYNAIVRTLIGGVPTQPFSMAGLPYLEPKNNNLGAALKQLSSAKYGRPKAQVEKEIFARLATAPKAPMMPQQPGANRQVPQLGQQRPAQPIAAPSFLDDWLKKRNMSQPAQQPVGQPIMNTSQSVPAQIHNPATQPQNASPAQPINYAPATFQQSPQQVPQNPVIQTVEQPLAQPMAEQGHIKIQTGQHSNQAEDMIIIDR
jgi:hypothetical protein